MEEDKELNVDNLLAGDRPSLYYLGFVGAHSIRKSNMAVFMVDVLGRVHLMNPNSVKILYLPKLSDEELNQFTEEEAIQLMLKQNDSEDIILEYLTRRHKTENYAPTDL